jgi:ubiquinol-cytochrome c reductase cytochrome b subunit
VVGERVWPRYAAKAVGWFFLTSGVLAGLGGLVQINAIWLYGPFNAAQVSSASQPDWYMGWLEGALRTMPPMEIRAFGFEVPNPFFPGVLLPGITFTLLYLWPFLEAKITGDRRPHHLLDRPRQRPARTGFGVAALTFYGVLTFAGASDVLSTTFSTSVNTVIRTFQVALVVLPIITGRLAWALCRELCERDGLPVPEARVHLPRLRRGPRPRSGRPATRTGPGDGVRSTGSLETQALD